MTTANILKLEKWEKIDAGLSSQREQAKGRAGAPFFKEFFLFGEGSKDALRSLVFDENDDIYCSSTLLLQQWPYLQAGMEQRDRGTKKPRMRGPLPTKTEEQESTTIDPSALTCQLLLQSSD